METMAVAHPQSLLTSRAIGFTIPVPGLAMAFASRHFVARPTFGPSDGRAVAQPACFSCKRSSQHYSFVCARAVDRVAGPGIDRRQHSMAREGQAAPRQEGRIRQT